MNTKEFKQEFLKVYGESAIDSSLFFSPGRVNLIGEHTDYNGGYVFPCALTFGTYLIIRLTGDDEIKFATTNFDYKATVKVTDIETALPDGAWVNYPLGVLNQLVKLGLELTGMELLYYGNIPNGAGLSSSASIELVTAVAINSIFSLGLETMQLAKVGQLAENEFVGVQCGILDQFAVAFGKEDHALSLKCDTMEWTAVPLTMNGYKIVIANTNKRRGLADSKYNERRGECEKAVEYISSEHPITFLGDIDEKQFDTLQNLIPDETVKKRAKHVITENQRCVDAVAALNAGDLYTFGQLMNGSHDSLRDDYEVTGIELDALVEEARKIEGVVGSRMTGAGFGGCTVSIVKEDAIDAFIKEVGEKYEARIGIKADFYIAGIGNGAREIKDCGCNCGC